MTRQADARAAPPPHRDWGTKLFVDVVAQSGRLSTPNRKSQASSRIREHRFIAPAQDLNIVVPGRGLRSWLRRADSHMRVRCRDMAEGDARGNDALRRLHLVDAVLDFTHRELDTAGEGSQACRVGATDRARPLI